MMLLEPADEQVGIAVFLRIIQVAIVLHILHVERESRKSRKAIIHACNFKKGCVAPVAVVRIDSSCGFLCETVEAGGSH